MTKNNSIITIEHLSKTFDGKAVLKDINLEIKEGEFVTLLGPSGCGKTTLLRIIGGFRVPDEGVVKMDGVDLCGIAPNKRPLNTVFQRYALFPHLDVYENVAFGLKLKHLPTSEIDSAVHNVLKMVSMTDYEDRDVESLSGGQQQRVAIARALVNHPRILLLDEPLAALDLKMRKDIQIELRDLHENLGITFLYVTHDQEEALTMSDTIVVMKEGEIQQIGTPSDIYNEPVNCFVADFIGESNILDAVMKEDYKVEFIGHEFECVDKGFGKDEQVDVVVRPEDIYIMKQLDHCQFTGTVKSCIFKGVHYEMFVDTDDGFEMMIQDYNAFEVGSQVGMLIKPNDIQVMKKECTANVFEGTVVSEGCVEFASGKWECDTTGFEAGQNVVVTVPFGKIDVMDNKSDGVVAGSIHFILYKGDHYHLTIRTDDGFDIFADTQDIWDKGDLVGVNIKASDIRLKAK